MSSFRKKIRDGKNKEEIDNLLDIFMGGHDDALKESLLSACEKQFTILKNIKFRKDVTYLSGYSQRDIGELLDFDVGLGVAGRPLAINVYIDAIVDIGNNNFKNRDEFLGFMSALTLRESHDVGGLSELIEPLAKISGSTLDVSSVVKPVLAGTNKSMSGEAISCLLAHSYYINKHPELYDNFVKIYRSWRYNPEGPLPWVFPGQGKETPFKLIGTDKGAMRHGSVQPLVGNGVLFGKSAIDPGIDFNFVRTDAMVDAAALPPQKFKVAEINAEDGRLHGVVGISRGDQANSLSTNGPVLGTWGARNSLDKNAVVIEVSNGQSGTIGINIPLDQVPEGKPYIISSGELSGCTMVYAVDGNNFFAYHTGQKAGDAGWLTSREGAASLYRAHLSLTGRPVSEFHIIDNVLVDGSEAAISGNDALVKVLATYDKSTINYFGKLLPDGASTKTTISEGNVNQFDYNEALASDGTRVGVAYALIIKDNGKVKVATYSEDMAVTIRDGKSEFLTLDNSEYVIKDFSEIVNKRKFEKAALPDESLLNLAPDEQKNLALIETVFSQDEEIKFYILNPYENSRNAVLRLRDLFVGGEDSGIIKGFGGEAFSQEVSEKIAGLKDLVRKKGFAVKIRAINYWDSVRKSKINQVNFALVLDFQTVKFILDSTPVAIIQNIGGPLIKAEQAWLRAYRQALTNSDATVKYKDFESYEEALEFSPAYPVEAQAYVEDAFLVTEASWYRQDAAALIDTISAEAISSIASPDTGQAAISSDAPVKSVPRPIDGWTKVALLRTLLASVPAKIGESLPAPDPVSAAGLIHFFAFEGGRLDAIKPDVSLRPFDSASTTTSVPIADNFGGKAMLVSSRNRAGAGLNGMRMTDDVSNRAQFSISFWFLSSGEQHHAPVLGNKDWGVALNPGFMIDQQNNGNLNSRKLRFNVADGKKRADTFIRFARNAWVYVAMTFDTTTSTATAYVADMIHGMQTATLNLDGMDLTKIAGNYSTIALYEDALGNYFSRNHRESGEMAFDDLAMWNRVLKPEEVEALAMSGITGGLTHFFPFENSPADVIARNVSLQPFDSASTTHASFIADPFGGEAMQVSSQNWENGALNGMRLTDDVSSHPQFSIGFWFKSDGEQNHAPVLANKDWSAGVNPGFVIDQQADGQLKFNVGDGKKRVDVFIPFSRDAWVYVVMTFDTAASTATAHVWEQSGVYHARTLDLRGMDMTKIRGAHSTIALNEDALGNYHSRRNAGYGVMAFNDLSMWNRVLTKVEVRALAGWGRSLSDLLPY